MSKTIRKSLILLVITAVMLTMLPGVFSMASGTDSTHSYAAERKTVRVGYMWGYNFQEGAKEGAPKSGFAYDYLQQIAAYSDWQYEYVYGSWEDLYKELEAGNIDVMAGISKTEEREQTLDFPDLPITMETYHIFVHQKDEAKYPDAESLRGKTVGVSADTLTADSLAKWNSDNEAGIVIVPYADDDERLEAFHKGETDATADLAMQVAKGDKMIPVLQFGASNTYIAVAKGHKDILLDMNNALAALNTQTPGFSANLYQKYFSDTAVLSTLTAEDMEWLTAHPTIYVGYLDHNEPLTTTGKDGKATGMYIDLIRYSFDNLGLSNEIQFKAYKDYDSMTKALNKGEIQIAGPIYDYAWRSEQHNIVQTGDIFSAKINLISRDPIKVTKKTVFGAVHNSSLQKNYLNEFYPKHKVIQYDTMKQLIKGIKKGEVDATVMGSYMISIYLRNDVSLEKTSLPNQASFSAGISPEHTVLLNILNRGTASWGRGYLHESLLMHTDEAYSPTLIEFVRANKTSFTVGTILSLIILALLGFIARQRSKAHKLAEYNAHYDHMTDLKNRRAYEEEVTRLEKKGVPEEFCVAVLDLNDLKKTNDTLGHDAGDELIKGLAECLRETITITSSGRRSMNVYRTGGDEFVAFYYVGFDSCKRSYDVFNEKVAAWKGQKIDKLSVSMGYVMRDEFPDASITEFVKIADNRMYEDKAACHRRVEYDRRSNN